MKKLDLHIHTVKTISDSEFIFSLKKLKEYVSSQEIDCIAITNHNLFDLEQFKHISVELDIVVFPGIEINLENGHLLLISDNNELEDFLMKANLVNEKIKKETESITINELEKIFFDLNKYLLIPHYDKTPSLHQEYINRLNSHIKSGEVSSAKKFIYHSKNVDSLVPVLFSDSRLTDETITFPTRQTFIDLQDISFAGIKSCLNDKHKVVLSKDKGNEFFNATDEIILSTGLNVILGERSSGKSHTLDRIFKENENVKYIKQFSLLQQDNEEGFNEQLEKEESFVAENFLKEFKELIEDIVYIDLEEDNRIVTNYLTSLFQNASEANTADIFSKAKLYNESKYDINDLSSLEKLIKATESLITNREYQDIISSHIKQESLKSLTVDLIKKFQSENEIILKKLWINDFIEITKNDLQTRSAQTRIEDIDFYRTLMNKQKIDKFKNIVNLIKNEKEIYSKDLGKFKIQVETKQYASASELKNKSKRQWKFSTAFNTYDNAYEFLKELKQIESLQKTDYYKYFVNVKYKILNRFGYEVSGGERSEFNLLNEIKDALKHDILLIDEPESSFDNQFLKSEVNTLIKDLSREIPIVLVTHNNTVGASIKPDFIIYTKRDLSDIDNPYKIFFGYPSDKKLKNKNGQFIDNYDVLINCLEAGETAYKERKEDIYEILKN